MLKTIRRSAFSLFFIALSLFTGFSAKIDIEARDLNGQDVKKFGGLIQSGALVTSSTGNALASGILNQDVIVGVNGLRVDGIFDLEKHVGSIRGKKILVEVYRVNTEGLLKLEKHTLSIQQAIDLQIRKALSVKLESDSPVTVGKYRNDSMLLWHANRVWVYDKNLEKERFVSLLKLYSMTEHKTFRHIVPESVIHSEFLTDTGLLLYVSNGKTHAKIGVIDIETGERNIQWHYEVKTIKEESYSIVTRDINGDNVPEIYFSSGGAIFCLDGATGNLIWNKKDLSVYLNHQRSYEDLDYSKIYIGDFNRDGSLELVVGPLLINAATGGKKSYLSFDAARYQGGVLEVRQLIGDPMPDIITKNGLYDGNSGRKVWEPLRSENYFLADLNGNGREEIAYLLNDRRLHVHEIETHRELYSVKIDGLSDLVLGDFNSDGYADIFSRDGDMGYVYQSNIPLESSRIGRQVDEMALLLDFGLQKDKFFIFGRDLFGKGLYEEAIPILLRALSDREDKTDVIRYLASAFIKTRNYDGALSLVRQKDGALAREVLKEFSSEIIAYLLDRNETWQAIHFLEMRKDEDPVLLARCYLAIGRPEVSLKILEKMENKPIEAQLILGKSYALLSRNISARIAYKSYLKQFPSSSEGWVELGELEAHEENWLDAEEAFKICKDLSPVDGLVHLSNFYLKKSPLKDIQKALSLGREAFRAEPSARTRIQLAHALIENGDTKLSEKYLQEVVDPGIYFNKHEKLLQRCQYQNQSQTKYIEAEKLLLSPVFKKRNFIKARVLLQEIINTYPKSPVFALAHFRLGEIFLDAENRDIEKAVYHFKEVIKLNHILSPQARSWVDKLKPAPGTDLQKVIQFQRPRPPLTKESASAQSHPPEKEKGAQSSGSFRRKSPLKNSHMVPFPLLKIDGADSVQEKAIAPVEGSKAEKPAQRKILITPSFPIGQEDL